MLLQSSPHLFHIKWVTWLDVKACNIKISEHLKNIIEIK
jgi:hypothetical protein